MVQAQVFNLQSMINRWLVEERFECREQIRGIIILELSKPLICSNERIVLPEEHPILLEAESSAKRQGSAGVRFLKSLLNLLLQDLFQIILKFYSNSSQRIKYTSGSLLNNMIQSDDKWLNKKKNYDERKLEISCFYIHRIFQHPN